MKFKLLLLWLCYCCAVGVCYAGKFNFIHYNTNNSQLPHDVCYRLLQDRQGYLWICTDDGLVRFDGRDMKVYQKGFRNRFVIAAGTYKDQFLISTWKGGVHLLENDQVVPAPIPPGTHPTVISSNNILLYHNLVLLYNFSEVSAFHYDPARHLFTPSNTVIRFRTGKSVPLDFNKDFSFTIIGDKLIAYNTSGTFMLEGNVFRQLPAKGYKHLAEGPGKAVFGLRDNRIYKLAANLLSDTPYREMPVSDILKNYSIEKYYMLSSGNLILRLSDHPQTFPFSARGKYAFVNVHTGEVSDLIKAMNINVLVADILADKNGNGFWISTDGDGLYHVFEPRYLQYGNDDEFRNPYVTSLIKDSTGQLYIGTKNGIYTLLHGNIQPIHGDYNVYTLCADKNGLPFARSKYRPGAVTLAHTHAAEGPDKAAFYTTPHYELEQFNGPVSFWAFLRERASGRQLLTTGELLITAPLNDCCEDAYGRLWFGSELGLFTWVPTMKAPVPCKPPLLQKACITKLCADSSGGLWVASKTGLFYLKDNKIVLQYDNSNGLSGLGINTILLYEGYLWIGTQGGLDILDLKTNQLITQKKHDGLISNDVTMLLAYRNNLVAVGSSKGITLIDAAHPGFSRQNGTIMLEQMLIGKKQVVPRTLLVADYHEQLTFSYNMISFIYPELTRFRYRLSAKDPWIETQNKSLVFSNLEPGSYQLELQAKTYNSGWCAPMTFALKIKDPWWATLPFFVLIAGIIALLIVLSLRTRERRYRQRMLVRQQFSELKLKALQTQLNPHFISNTLNAIQLLFLRNDELATNNYLTRFAHLTRLLLESSRTRFITLRDELEITSHYLSLEKLRFQDRFTYQIAVDEAIDPLREYIPGVLLQPFVENSINHGIGYLPHTANGIITVTISKHEGMLHIQITDNGVGRQKVKEIQQRTAKTYQSRSTEIIREISQAVNSLPGCFIDISITDLLDNRNQVSGTTVLIRCHIHQPTKKNYENSYH